MTDTHGDRSSTKVVGNAAAWKARGDGRGHRTLEQINKLSLSLSLLINSINSLAGSLAAYATHSADGVNVANNNNRRVDVPPQCAPMAINATNTLCYGVA